MKRLLPLVGAVLALALSSTAAADTFRVVRPHTSGSGGAVSFAPDAGVVIPFNGPQSGPMSFAALRSIWQAAGNAYGIPWEVLGAINKVETNFGQNLGPSSAGAVGWMQFMPSTWARWGIDANADGVADPDNPTDAIFSAARYLVACGGQADIARAIYCYNHATWYVDDVLGLASQYGGGGDNALLSVGQLRSQLHTARTQVTASKAQLVAARARAGNLAHVQRRFLHVAATARLLSDQLEARKHAVLLGVRRHAAEARVARLNKRLDAAATQLESVRSQANAASNPEFLSASAGSSGGVISVAMQYLGVPYVWGGASPSGFDCSGLVQYAFAQVGVSLPHYTVSQWNYPGALSVPRNRLQPGDLVFFNGLDHVGIYLGFGNFIDSPHTGAAVRIDNLREPWYAAKYDGAKRIVAAPLGSLAQAGGATSFTTAASTLAFAPNVVYFTR
jgi:cell wall-associated NlpC family hydrolase